mmetsp:Transcript_53955/g.96607  ORF Transcript_53955/g.96607 Transcript_53955/m.96607 type:complete len:586 (+) Transcript_53955:33-1790(+)
MTVGGLRPSNAPVGVPAGVGAWRPTDHPGVPVRPVMHDMQDVQQRLLRDQAAATAAFIDNFTMLGDEVAALKSSQAAVVAEISSRADAQVKELKERILILENAMRGHGSAHDMAHSKLQKLHERLEAVEDGSLQQSLDDVRDAHDSRHNEMLARMAHLEGKIGDSLDKHDQHQRAMDYHQASHSELSSEVKSQSAHQAHILQRLSHAENMVGEAAKRHASELGTAQRQLDQLQHQLRSDDLAKTAIDELRQSHMSLAADKDAAAAQHEKLRDQHLKLEQRLKEMERRAADSHGDHSMQLVAAINSVKDIHAKLGADRSDQEARFKSADERLKNIEAYVGSSANDHAHSVHAVHQSLKDLHGEVADELNKRGVHQASMDERLRRMEVAAGESLDSHGSSLEAAHRKIDEFDSQLRGAKESIIQVHESLRGEGQRDQLAAEERLKRLEKANEALGKKLQDLNGRLTTQGSPARALVPAEPKLEERIRSLETRVLGGTTSNVFLEAKQVEAPSMDAGISAAAMASWGSMSTMDRSFFKSVTAVIVEDDGGAPLSLPPLPNTYPQASPASPLARVASLPTLKPGGKRLS